MNNTLRLSVLSGLLALVVPMAASAQMKASEWQFRASIYGWFPGISGTTEFPSGASGPSLNVDADTLIDSLKFAFMGTFEARKDNWGIWTDVFYSDVGGDKSGTRDFTVGRQSIPAGVTANLSLDAKTWIWTIAGTYGLINSPDHSMEVLLGARMVDMEQTLNYSFSGNIASLGLAGPTGSKSVSVTNWDAVVGIKGQVFFDADRKWFLPYYLDIGTGQSKFTWQTMLGVGYQFSKSASVVAAWRYLDYEMDSGNPIQTLNFNGALVGLVFSF